MKINSKEVSNKGSVLETLEENKIKVGYGCRKGFCGQCAIKVNILGEIHQMYDPIGFCKKTEILSCCYKASNKIEVLI